MATTLKKTNVVIVGLGAAGGVACLPLAQAGIDVIGLDAAPAEHPGHGTRRVEAEPQSLASGPQKTDGEAPTFRANASAKRFRAPIR